MAEAKQQNTASLNPVPVDLPPQRATSQDHLCPNLRTRSGQDTVGPVGPQGCIQEKLQWSVNGCLKDYHEAEKQLKLRCIHSVEVKTLARHVFDSLLEQVHQRLRQLYTPLPSVNNPFNVKMSIPMFGDSDLCLQNYEPFRSMIAPIVPYLRENAFHHHDGLKKSCQYFIEQAYLQVINLLQAWAQCDANSSINFHKNGFRREMTGFVMHFSFWIDHDADIRLPDSPSPPSPPSSHNDEEPKLSLIM